MTERKPPNMDFGSWVDKQIRDSMARGDFDNLPGAGKPLPRRDAPDDELWWLRDFVRREEISNDALLPPGILLRKRLERLPETVRRLRSERAVREAVAELNQEIVAWLRAPSGPWRPVAPVNVDDVVEQWRDHQRRALEARAAAAPPAAGVPVRRARRWWGMGLRRRG